MENEFGKHVKQMRKLCGISQEQLAKSCGISNTYLSKIENGRLQPPSERTTRAMAAAFKGEDEHVFPILCRLLYLAGHVPFDARAWMFSDYANYSLIFRRAYNHFNDEDPA